MLLWPYLAQAQINESDTARFQGRASLTGNWQTGNVEMLALRGKLEVLAAPSRKLVFKTQNAYLYQEFFRRRADEDIFSRNFLYWSPQRKLYPFAMLFMATNYRRQIDFRYFTGAGLTWQALKQDGHLIKLSASAVYEQSTFLKNTFNEPVYNGRTTLDTWRATVWLMGRHRLGKRLTLHYEGYLQPSVQDAADFRWQAEAGLDVLLGKGFSFTGNFVYTYEGIVALPALNRDQILTFGLAYKW